MGFSKKIFESEAARADYKCLVCGLNMKKKKKTDVAMYEIHSATSLHLTDGPYAYLVNDPPLGFENLKGKRIEGRFFAISRMGFSHDAFCLCPTHHRDIHTEALTRSKILFPSFKGRTAIPVILEEVTLEFIYHGKSIRPI